MSTIDSARLVVLAADELQLVGVGQTLPTEDSEKLEDRVDEMLEELASMKIVHISSSDAIPSALADPLAKLLAERCGPTFGRPRDPVLKEQLEDRIRLMVKIAPPTQNILTADSALIGAHGGYSQARWLRGV